MATIQGIYIALFGRPADPLGLEYFNEETNNGADLTAIGDLSASEEYLSRFEGQNAAQIVNSIYQSLFNRPADAAGLAYFVAELTAGRQTINTIAINILDGAQGADLTTVNNKITAANNFTNALDTGTEIVGYSGDQAAAAGRAFLQGVTDQTSSIPTTAATDAAVVNATQSGGGGTGATFTLTTGVDFADNAGSVRNNGDIPSDFRFSTSNDTVVASSLTLNAGDVISDASTTDEDVAQVAVNGAGAVIDAFTNIENFDLTFSAGGGNVDFTGSTGIQDIDLFGTVSAVRALIVADTGVTSIDGSALGGAGYFADLSTTGNTALTLIGSAQADTLLGGAGSDTFTLGDGNDGVFDGAGADVIRGQGGADTISLANDSASDRIIFEATASANGSGATADFIVGFVGGGTNGDILDVSAFNGEAASVQVISGDTYVGGVAQDDGSLGTAFGGVSAGAASNVLVIRFDTDITNEAQLEAVINSGATGRLTLAAESSYVIALDTDSGAGGVHQLFYVTTGLNGQVTADTVELVGTVTTTGDLAAANFA